MRATVVVLGDLARSPRTVLHAYALANAGADVDLLGFADDGWRPRDAPATLSIHPLESHSGGDAGEERSYTWSAIVRGARLCADLARQLLWAVPAPDVVLVQNPPGVPVLAVAWLAARIRGARLAIDWHNLTWSMLGLRLGSRHPLVRAVSHYERTLGRLADVNLFVSSAMQRTLQTQWTLEGIVFRDRPDATFHPLAGSERLEVRGCLLERVGEPNDPDSPVVVTSTSWTADEDFTLLLDALRSYDAIRAQASASKGRIPRTVVLMTGRGPLRLEFERRLEATRLQTVGVHTIWLDPYDYARALAAADLGVCMHRSSSGLDLPMKVLDMFGAGIPVCAFDYGVCVSELIADGVNGLLFRTAGELAQHLSMLLEEAPSKNPVLQRLRSSVLSTPRSTWQQAWKDEVWPLLRRA